MEDIVEKLKALSLPEKLIAGGGVLMFIAGFFPWWSWSELGFSASEGGWGQPGSIWSVLVILISLVLAGIVLARALGNVALPDLGPSLTWPKVFAGAGVAIVVLMLLKLWRIMDVPAGGMGWGFFVAIIAAALVVAGCFLMYQEMEGRRTT